MEPSNTGPMNTTNFSWLAMSSSGTSINITSTELNVDLVLSSCSDGMSDIIYDYTSSLTTGMKNYSGCGNVN
jgi:uncharacterized membrane protein